MATKAENNVPSTFHPQSRLRHFKLGAWSLAVLFCGSIFSSPLMADESQDPFLGMKPPTSEWSTRMVNKEELPAGVKEELQIEVKGKEKAVNAGLRIGTDLPISSKSFLDQVRQRIAADKDYQGAEITSVKSKSVGGKQWDFFVIQRKDEIHQEFWARSISSDQILMLLYTALGNYYDQYHKDYNKILEQAAGI